MDKLHYKQRLKYLNAVANYLIGLGYHVEKPHHDDDYLNVWGTVKRRRCFQQIDVFMYECRNGYGGINGVWHQGDHDGVEVFYSNNPDYGLDTRECLEQILDDLKPFKRGKMKETK